MKTLQEIASYFQGVTWNGDKKFTARSPLRRDSNPSLSVSIDNKGTILFKDFGEPETTPNKVIVESILQATGLTWEDILPEKEQKKDGKFDYNNIVATYEYGHGIQKRRDIKKNFQWRYWNGRSYIYKQPKDVEPYHRGEPGETIYFFEGEKDVDNAAAKLNLFSVSPFNGANLPTKKENCEAEIAKYQAFAKDRNVIITPDNDDKGRNFAERLAAELSDVAKTLKVVDLKSAVPELKEKGDISDVIEMYGKEKTLQLFSELVVNTPEWVPFTAPEEDIFAEFGFYSVPDLTEEERKPPEFIIDGMIPVGMTVLAGAPKIRKSFLALQMAISVAKGTTFFGHNTHQCDVAYLDLEGSKSRISSRTDRMSEKIPKNVHVTNFTDEETKKWKLADGSLINKIRKLHRQKPTIKFFIIDTYSRARGNFRAGGANAYDADVSLLEPVQRMAMEENISILFVHHDSKGAGFKSDSFERVSGSMGITGSADCVINMIAEGKRSDGKATFEFTPRDAKGGELKLIFNTMTLEWYLLPDLPVDIEGNPICKWIIDHAPDKHKEGEFYPYEQVFREAYHADIDKPGDKVIEQIKQYKEELFKSYNIGIQTGVQSHSRRGIRIINLL